MRGDEKEMKNKKIHLYYIAMYSETYLYNPKEEEGKTCRLFLE